MPRHLLTEAVVMVSQVAQLGDAPDPGDASGKPGCQVLEPGVQSRTQQPQSLG